MAIFFELPSTLCTNAKSFSKLSTVNKRCTNDVNKRYNEGKLDNDTMPLREGHLVKVIVNASAIDALR